MREKNSILNFIPWNQSVGEKKRRAKQKKLSNIANTKSNHTKYTHRPNPKSSGINKRENRKQHNKKRKRKNSNMNKPTYKKYNHINGKITTEMN